MTTGIRTKEVVEVVSVSTPIKDKGICVTCSHAPTCVFLKASHRPTWFCEEFDELEAAPAGFGILGAPMASLPVHTNGNGNGNGNGVSVGLCYNCDVRATCTFRKPGKPVYDCEEYQ